MSTESNNPADDPKYDPWDTSNDRTIIAYHANCLDGWTAAWAAYRGLEHIMMKPELLAMEYNIASTQSLFDKLAGGNVLGVLVVDFSLPVEALARLQSCHPSVFVNILDHHKTAFEAYAPDVIVEEKTAIQGKLHECAYHLDNFESGASLTYKNFNLADQIDQTLPKLIDHVRDYDLWRFEHGDKTKWVNKYLMTQERTLQRWDELLEMFDNEESYAAILDAGRELQEAHMHMVTKIARTAKKVTLQGLEGLYVMCPFEYMSDVGHELAEKCGTYGLMVVIDEDKKKAKWSLRSSGDFDVSALAKLCGGGGHKNAAGFETGIEYAKDMMRRVAKGGPA